LSYYPQHLVSNGQVYGARNGHDSQQNSEIDDGGFVATNGSEGHIVLPPPYDWDIVDSGALAESNLTAVTVSGCAGNAPDYAPPADSGKEVGGVGFIYTNRTGVYTVFDPNVADGYTDNS
jgi:hypothetical protein